MERVYGAINHASKEGEEDITSDTVFGNEVSIKGGTVDGGVYGGFNWNRYSTYNSTNNTPSATGNRVRVSGGRMVKVSGGESYHGNVTNNVVEISAGVVESGVYGGYTNYHTYPITASGNSVIINGGQIGGEIAGGYVLDSGGYTSARNNTVTIRGTFTKIDEIYLYGGRSHMTSTGNTLNLYNVIPTVNSMGFFQHLSFYLPSNLGAGGASMLHVTDTVDITDLASISVKLNGAGPPLQPGYRYTLLLADELLFKPFQNHLVSGLLDGYAYTVGITDGRSIVVEIDERVISLTFIYSPVFNIPASTAGIPIASIDVTDNVGGGTPPYTFSASGLPTGISINPTTGIISGKPTLAGSAGMATITATDSAGDSELIVISYGAIAAASVLLTFTNDSAFDIPVSTVGTAIAPISVLSGVSGGAIPYTFSAVGLPAGITIDPVTGIISGIPTAASVAGTAIITVTDSVSAGESITINYGAIVVKGGQTSSAISIPMLDPMALVLLVFFLTMVMFREKRRRM
jgi:hypothetical protein